MNMASVCSSPPLCGAFPQIDLNIGHVNSMRTQQLFHMESTCGVAVLLENMPKGYGGEHQTDFYMHSSNRSCSPISIRITHSSLNCKTPAKSGCPTTYETFKGQESRNEMLSIEDGLECSKLGLDLPSVESFINTLQQCRAKRRLANAKQVYTQVCSSGLEANTTISNFLVPTFVDCGGISVALQIFHKLVFRNEHSWTSLISGYVQCGELKCALSVYPLMLDDGICSSLYTILALLKACAALRNKEEGQNLHTEIAQKGLDKVLPIGNSLVTMYSRCGSLVEAQEIFNKLPVQDVVSWTALMTAYIEHGLAQEALTLYELMKLQDLCPNAFTFVSGLKACACLGALEQGQKLHAEIREKGLEQNLFVGSTLVDMYVKCGSLIEARKVFIKLTARDVVTWTTMISAFADYGFGKEALDYFAEMELEGISPNVGAFTSVLKACATLKTIEKGRELHMEIKQKGFLEDSAICNSLISMYANCGALSEAHGVFDVLPVQDAVSWNAIISGYSEHGHWQEALQYFNKMKLAGISPNVITYCSVLKACGSMKAVDVGQEIHMEIRQKGMEADLLIGNSLVGMYAKCGCISKSEEAFDKLMMKNVISWNALIGGYARFGIHQKAFDTFEQMQVDGFTPDGVTFACVLKVCSTLGALGKGREIHRQLREAGFAGELSICKNLINMYAKCGLLSEACTLFQGLPVRDVEVWSLMIQAYGVNNQGNSAVLCFEEMQEQCMIPDGITFTCLLSACRHGSLVCEGMKYFKMMREKYAITPTAEHYNCMVDLLARSGCLYEAEKFLELLCPLSEEMWSALLSACKTYGEAELGLRCFQQLVLINPEDSAWYVVMADIYESGGRLQDAARVEGLRKLVQAKKKPAIAWIEVKETVHEFVVGNEHSKEVVAMLKKMNLSLKAEGHLPNADLVLKPACDNEKERSSLCEHAEKVAIAFGLLSTPHGTTLRVSKNLRMCNDCHNASKIISRIEKREIILRDSCCVHHFKDSVCSCGDVY